MTVTITPRGQLQRRDTYDGVTRVVSDGSVLTLYCRTNPPIEFALWIVAAIALDEDGGAVD